MAQPSDGPHRSERHPSADDVPRRVGIVIVTYNAERHIEACLASLRGADRSGLDVRVIVVDNASRDATVSKIQSGFPEESLLELRENLGFAAGNNVGIEHALSDGAEFVYLLNPDTTVAPSFLKEALAVMEAFPRAGAVQSLLLLSSDPDRINTSGNIIHFLGFGYCGQFREPRKAAPKAPVEIAFASGAAVLLRASALREVGLFDPELFLYQEDLDLGWRMRLAGYDNVLAPRSVVHHDYEFSRNPAKYYFIERNRYVVLLKNLSLRSLAALAPALIAAEIPFFTAAAAGGWLPAKARAVAQLLRPRLWRHVLRERTRVASLRKRTDREIALLHRSDLTFEGVTSPFIARIANPCMHLVWKVVRRAIA